MSTTIKTCSVAISHSSRRKHLLFTQGVCQLVAHLYLSSREGRRAAERTRGEEGDISDEGLRKFFLFSIEKERSEIYGDGFRKAAELYRSLGLEPILQILVETGEFPG